MFRILLIALLPCLKGYEKNIKLQRTAPISREYLKKLIFQDASRRNRSIDVTPKFQCDGRTHCSQMTSCARSHLTSS